MVGEPRSLWGPDAATPTVVPHPPLRMVPHETVPIFINSFNRLASLKGLVEWLRRAGYSNIVVVDNASSYKPLVDFLAELDRSSDVRVVRLAENAGHTALWSAHVLETLGVDSEFVYTDPDVVPAESCPPDLVRSLQQLLDSEPTIFKAGLGLRLDDIPRLYRHRRAVLAWETKYWLRPAAPGLFVAPIDTTFALYRPGSAHGPDELALRTGPPLVASHESWYTTGLLFKREERFYARHAARNSSATWSRVHLPAWLRNWEKALDVVYPTVLLVATDGSSLPGYLSVENTIGSRGTRTLALADGAVDGFYLPDGTEELARIGVSIGELHRVAKDGAKVVLRIRLPAAAVTRPFPGELSDWLGAGSPAPWHLERSTLVASPSEPDVIVEQIVHLRARKSDRSGAEAQPEPVEELTTSNIDLHAAFDRLPPNYA